MDSTSMYSPLETSRKEVRLIDIISTTPTIVCKLSTVSLQDEPAFNALSYVWGDPEVTEFITVDGKPISITINLANALRDVHEWNEDSASREEKDPRPLWADALCIDQNDTQEKNHQIPLMGDIYSRAETVLAWAGLPDEALYTAFDMYEIIARELSMLPSDEKDTLAWLEKYVQQEEGSDDASPKRWDEIMRNILPLEDRPNWTRVWITQELVLASTVALISGNRALNLEIVFTVFEWIADPAHRIPRQKPYYISDRDWYILNKTKPLSKFNNICLAKGRLAAKKEAEATRGLPDAIGTWHGFLQLYLLLKGGYYRAKNPKDYIYGFSAICNTGLTPDYSEEKTVAEVYCDFTTAWISIFKHAESARIYDATPLRKMIRDLHFLDYAGIGYYFSYTIPNLPSWAPNFAGVSEHQRTNRVMLLSEEGQVYPVCPCNTSCELPKVLGRKLHCHALLFEKIEIFDQRTEPGNKDQPDIDRRFTIKCDATLALEDSEYLSDTVQYLSTFLRILRIGNSTPSTQPISTLDVFNVLRHSVPGIPFEELAVFCSVLFRICEKLGIEKITTVSQLEEFLEQTKFEIHSMTHDFLRSLQVVHDMRFAFTEHGHLGLFPPLIAIDDIVALVKGYTTPVVLRKIGNQYVFVGACLVPDLMETDITQLVEKRGITIETIEIV